MSEAHLPIPILDIVKKAADEHPDAIERALELALREIQSLPGYSTFIDQLVRRAVRGAIHEYRHQMNVKMKRAEKIYGGAPKVKHGTSKGVGEAYRFGYNYFIAGRTIGSMLGRDLEDIARDERGRAIGHMFNARLCEELCRHVKPEQTVREVVSENRLRLIAARVDEEVTGKKSGESA